MRRFFVWLAGAALVIGALQVTAPAVAQTSSDNKSDSKAPTALIPSTLRGLGSMGTRGVRRFCDPRAIGLSGWRTATLTQMLDLDQRQQAALSELAGVSAKALDMIATTCQRRTTEKPQLATIEERVETLLQVLRTVRPAYDAFYTTLNSQQQQRVDALGPGRAGWRW
jgi:hypothetical protein